MDEQQEDDDEDAHGLLRLLLGARKRLALQFASVSDAVSSPAGGVDSAVFATTTSSFVC